MDRDVTNAEFNNLIFNNHIHLMNDRLPKLDVKENFNYESTILNNCVSQLMKGSISKCLVIDSQYGNVTTKAFMKAKEDETLMNLGASMFFQKLKIKS